MFINPICCLPPINDFPFIEGTFKELDLYSLICSVGHKVNELVAQGNDIEKNLKTLFDEAIKNGEISANINGVYDPNTKTLTINIRSE